MYKFLLFLSIFVLNVSVYAHGGRTDSSGCHNSSSGRHCHNSYTPPPTTYKPTPTYTPPVTTPEPEVKTEPEPEPVPTLNCDGYGGKQCPEMASCEEAKFYFSFCGGGKLDADDDSVPCENVCGVVGTPEVYGVSNSAPEPTVSTPEPAISTPEPTVIEEVTPTRNIISGQNLIIDNDLCLDVVGDDLYKLGGHVQVWACNDAPNQQWSFDESGRLVNGGGLCLDVAGENLHKQGGHVQIWNCNDAPNQQWSLNNNRLLNGGGLCLDVAGNELHKLGGHVQVWECNGAPNQHWVLGNGQRVDNDDGCGIYDIQQKTITMPCIAVGNMIYKANINGVGDSQFEADVNTISPVNISSMQLSKCTVYDGNKLEINCMRTGERTQRATLMQTPDKNKFLFDIINIK